MSKLCCRQNDFNLLRRRVWGRLLGSLIRENREMNGRSVEEAVRLAGMEASEWRAVEAGQVPNRTQLRFMADAIGIGRDEIATSAIFCRDAWEA